MKNPYPQKIIEVTFDEADNPNDISFLRGVYNIIVKIKSDNPNQKEIFIDHYMQDHFELESKDLIGLTVTEACNYIITKKQKYYDMENLLLNKQ